MKIKLCQGLWLVSFNKYLMDIEPPLPSEACQSILQEAWGIPKGLRMRFSSLKIIYFLLANSFKVLDSFTSV